MQYNVSRANTFDMLQLWQFSPVYWVIFNISDISWFYWYGGRKLRFGDEFKVLIYILLTIYGFWPFNAKIQGSSGEEKWDLLGKEISMA